MSSSKLIRKINIKIKNHIYKAVFPNNFFYFSQKGYCPCCDKEVVFRAFDNWLRDYFLCSNCRSIPRERALMLVIEKYYPNWKDLYIHESSPSNRGTSIKLKENCYNYTPTQYLPDKPLGVVVNGYKNENLESLTFDDESFDLVITQDVMEHIYYPDKAFKEIARTLKKGGAHIFTVPIINKFNKTEIWALKDDNSQPIFLVNPEYHGNPIDPKGSPVTMHWGFDIINYIKENSGLDTVIEHIDDLNYGIRAEYIEVLVSIKK
jgi:SAM-dependent methyltransferase